MKKSKSILDFFKKQSEVNNIPCPACGVSILRSKLNEHLDNGCTSSRSVNASEASTDVAKNTNCKEVKINPKVKQNEQKKSQISIPDDDVIILDDDFRPSRYNLKRSVPDSKALKGKKQKSDKPCTDVKHSKTDFGVSASPIKTNSDVNVTNEVNNTSNVIRQTNKRKFSESNNVIEAGDCLEIENLEIKPDWEDLALIINNIDESVKADGDVFAENKLSPEPKQGEIKMSLPYYIANFKHILKTVLEEEDNKILFNEEDWKFMKSFEAASITAQKVYVRLFQRKYKWLRSDKIKYPEISDDLTVMLDELIQIGLIDSGANDIDLGTALDLLSLQEARNIFKHFKFNPTGKNKADINQAILKHCKQQKSVFFSNSGNHISATVLKKVRQIITPCYRVSILPRRLFTRILMLFSLPTLSDDDEEAAGGQQQQLLTLLQVNKGELTFPEYKRTKEVMIFENRDELIRYEEARQLENDILNAIEAKKFELAKDLYIKANELFENQSSFSVRVIAMPVFLKRFTSFHVYTRCMSQGVDILQRLKLYEDAVTLLRRLLKQKEFCQDYRGRWWDRLALNLEQHLKLPDEALEAIKLGMEDGNVRVGHRFALLTRALRILKSVHESDEFKQKVIKEASVTEAPKVIIKGRLFPRDIMGRRNVFISSSNIDNVNDDISVLCVEQVALEHYKEHGFPQGVHGEGSTFISLYCLLFWDIIYDGSIPDVFISLYQTHPLDLNSDVFFSNRKDLLLNRLEKIRNSTEDELKEMVRLTWEAHHGTSSLVTWDRFTDLENAQGLVACFGSKILSGICERLAKDFRFTRSGVPDLVVWNPVTKTVKVVEVKGPGDKLSPKQILWLEYLLNLGVDAEVCLVEAVGSKKLR